MNEMQDRDEAVQDSGPQDAEQAFRNALLRSHRKREFIGEMESAAAQYCREARRQGHAPERMLRDAKRVIEQAIDGDDMMVAERAVLSCIQHYYRPD